MSNSCPKPPVPGVRSIAHRFKDDGPAFVGLIGLTMFLAWWLGQEVGWDLRNYHFYNAYLLLDHRFARDVEPAGVQTYFNPLIDIPFYVAVRIWKLKPMAFGLSWAAFHGLSLCLVYKITKIALSDDYPMLAAVAAPVAGLTAAFGAAFYTEIGATSGDNTVSVLVLAALAALLRGIGADRSLRRRSARLSGALVGLATGAKLVAGMYAVGLLAGVLVLGHGFRRRAAGAFNFCAFAALGFLVTNGFWMWLMLKHFGSPLFPFLDASMRSPYAPVTGILAARYKPHTLAQGIFYPFFFLTPQTLTGEQPFRDGRLAVAFVSVTMIVLVALARRRKKSVAFASVSDTRLLVFAVFVAVSYVAWLRGSPVYRYAVSLELTAPVLLLACLAYWLRSSVKALSVGMPVCLLLVGSVAPESLGRVPWASTYFGVDETLLSSYRDATILLWNMPNAYLIPFFPSSATFIGIDSNWPEMRIRAEQRIQRADRRRMYLLDLPQLPPLDERAVLASFGLALEPTLCHWRSSLIEAFRVCPLIDLHAAGRDALPSSLPTSVAPATYDGNHDATDCTVIWGWAWDQSRPNVPLEIVLYDEKRPFARVTANQFRQDLLDAKKGNGEHAFTIPMPAELRDGKAHEISVKFDGTWTTLRSGPKQITCSPR